MKNWSDGTMAIINKLQSERMAVMEQAAWAMVEHYQCKFEDLTLERTPVRSTVILKKDCPGLAYLIKCLTEGETCKYVAEPIYLERGTNENK